MDNYDQIYEAVTKIQEISDLYSINKPQPQNSEFTIGISNDEEYSDKEQCLIDIIKEIAKISNILRDKCMNSSQINKSENDPSLSLDTNQNENKLKEVISQLKMEASNREIDMKEMEESIHSF